MTTTDQSEPVQAGHAVPPVVDHDTWQAARAELLDREKAHTREGDAIAAARRRLPMTEVDATAPLMGPDGPTTLVELFGDREELVVYKHMWHAGQGIAGQCAGCTLTYWATQEPAYLTARGVSFAVFAQAPYDELEPFVEFMGYPRHWYSVADVDDEIVAGDEFGQWTSWLRQGDRVFLTGTLTGRGAEATMPTLALLDLTVRGRRETWQDSPAGWPEGGQPGWFWMSDEHYRGTSWTGGRPTVQWTRPGALPGTGTHAHAH
ncbi:putative dithiol-disulfide oxidoreductase (DUF899 family) [Isoptericola sp. CG 20/1183]|uniref:Dithiol-disulfide oxidoreductase (DUF899 family) n=1 Tax=Isoptericola halotolerans TaxID=300560 RepID=A0ABX5EAN0_9MICO|nr:MULTISPECIES: DUF899 family protein [Isoptericola]PRZ03828.1 putative dithiol-disulfide oxidoreductase (DUF899 family) [Isoptericola sp. CG 20/1183]PRZ04039.1 putative dithiol-disulfide oxidoreductase (DUF899 family) [Isoptericola halotolerans]